jgi:hypothetical protein
MNSEPRPLVGKENILPDWPRNPQAQSGQANLEVLL